jgi:hypothetical protein
MKHFLLLLLLIPILAFSGSSYNLSNGGAVAGGPGKWQVRTDFTFENISTPASSFIRTRMNGEDIEVEGWVQA